MKKKQKAQAGNRRMPENKKAASRVGLTFSEKSLMQGISILPFLQWTMPEICRRSIRQPIRITPIRKRRTVTKAIRLSSFRSVQKQPSLPLLDLYNTSDTRGSQRSYGMNYQKTGKDVPYLFVKSSVALNLS